MARLVEAYAARSVHRPGDPLSCRLGDERIAGRFAGFDPRGRLRLATAGSERILATADLVIESTAEGASGNGTEAADG